MRVLKISYFKKLAINNSEIGIQPSIYELCNDTI